MNNRKTKRRRTDVFNKLEGGLECSPKICEGILPKSGEFTFTVPSKSDDTKSYDVTVNMELDGSVKTKCTCKHGNDCYNDGTMYCIHINASFIFFLSKFIKSTQKSYDLNSLQSEMNDLTAQLGNALEFE